MKKRWQQELYSLLKCFVFAIIIVVICRNFLFSPSVVHGESMSPTFEDGNKVILSKISDIEHFDMIVFHAPDQDANYIKRVIGLPGDTVSMKDDVLYINGKAYTKFYLKENKLGATTAKLTGDPTLEEETGEKTVPNNSLFVLGDNRLKSKDSRDFGFISDKSVIGKVVLRIYPLNEIGLP
ncbi:signal peptidase I [Niallia sp. Man26]|uniref:signal peptidase I n=1 Tax=Niallia sp. Man26 TaxID=2912824 RepID=UPI001EDC509A|nr:signal peptidase I [Niallia sp. Man26]UPO89201.1 signal peptidase I [Niallia sp. Man26]